MLALLSLALVTGTLAFGTGTTAPARLVTLAHGLVGLAVLVLVPWKQAIVRRGLGRARSGTWASILLAVVVAVTIAFGFVHTFGRLVPPAALTAMQVHVGAALTMIPLVVWHVVHRPQPVRRVHWQRREALRTLALLGVAAAGWTGVEGMWRLLGARGAQRRATGSHATSFPVVTMWLNDRTPSVEPSTWALTTTGPLGQRRWSLADLEADVTVTATIDCTNGWQSTQAWSGVPLARLVGDPGPARSLVVTSLTGYSRRYPIDDLPHLLLATAVAGRPLAPAHGYPARLVAPGRRGFWWVKWVERIELSSAPAWAQPPFPLT